MLFYKEDMKLSSAGHTDRRTQDLLVVLRQLEAVNRLAVFPYNRVFNHE